MKSNLCYENFEMVSDWPKLTKWIAIKTLWRYVYNHLGLVEMDTGT